MIRVTPEGATPGAVPPGDASLAKSLPFPMIGDVPQLPEAPVAEPVAYVSWYSTRANRAAIIASRCPGLTPGTMYLARGEEYTRLPEDTEFFIAAAYGEWCTFAVDGHITNRWSTYSAEAAAAGAKESVETLVVGLVPARAGRGPEPFVATMGFRTARCRAARTHLAAALAAETPDWLARHPLAQSVPPAFRVVSTFINEMRTSRNGRVYGVSTALTQPIADRHVRILIDWWQTPKAQQETARAIQLYELRRSN